MSDNSFKKLLRRTALTVPFQTFLSSLSNTYPQLGSIKKYEPVLVGYEAANILLKTSNGEYFLKIFESDRDRKNIDSLILVHIQASKIGVPVPQLVNGKDGYLSIFQDVSEVPYFITEKFEGKTFEFNEPTLEDMSKVCQYLALLNTLSFPVVEEYDPWGNKNIVREYDNLQGFLDEKKEVALIVEAVRSLPLSRFSKGVIHGDLQTKHVIKNSQGEYCILDFGCMSLDAKVIELSTFLAWFCFSEKNWVNHSEIIQKMISIYSKIHHLTGEEISSLPILVRSAYASYYLKTSQLIAEGDNSDETKKWNTSAHKLLELSNSL